MVACGDHGPVGDRVGVRNADFEQVRAGCNQLGNEQRRRREIGIAGRHERHECAAFFVPEPREQRVDAIHVFGPQLRTVFRWVHRAAGQSS